MPSRNDLATGIPSNKVKYSRLSSTNDGYIDLQFKKSPPKIPHKAILLVTVRFLIGTFLNTIGSLLLAGCASQGGREWEQTRRSCPDHWHPSVAAGFSHFTIACCASKCYLGYPCNDIPGFEDYTHLSPEEQSDGTELSFKILSRHYG